MFKEKAKLMILYPFAFLAIGMLAGYIGPRIIGNPCSNAVTNETVSPNKKNKLIVFTRDCGATTGFGTHVSLLSIKRKLKNNPGNIFTADSDHGKCPSSKNGGPVVKVKWESNEKIVVEYHEKARVFKSENELDGIVVVYKKTI